MGEIMREISTEYVKYKDSSQKLTTIIAKKPLGLEINIMFHNEQLPSSDEIAKSVKVVLDTPWWVN